MTWSNAPLALFHGTHTVALGSSPSVYDALRFSIDPQRCRADTDFGKGFYTTTSLHQATQWANNSVRIAQSQGLSTDALVLRFQVDRDEIATLETLCFIRDTDDYYEFVSYCRTRGRLNPGGDPSHGRSGGMAAFDVVFGPVALGLQRLVLQGCDQVSFHSDAAFRCLCRNDVIVYDRAAVGSGFLP